MLNVAPCVAAASQASATPGRSLGWTGVSQPRPSASSAAMPVYSRKLSKGATKPPSSRRVQIQDDALRLKAR